MSADAASVRRQGHLRSCSISECPVYPLVTRSYGWAGASDTKREKQHFPLSQSKYQSIFVLCDGFLGFYDALGPAICG